MVPLCGHHCHGYRASLVGRQCAYSGCPHVGAHHRDGLHLCAAHFRKRDVDWKKEEEDCERDAEVPRGPSVSYRDGGPLARARATRPPSPSPTPTPTATRASPGPPRPEPVINPVTRGLLNAWGARRANQPAKGDVFDAF
eukprot:13357740-Heterocapsa_arctica.AAC.1